MVFNLKWRTKQNQCFLNVTQIYEMWARCPYFVMDVLLNYPSLHLESNRSTFLRDSGVFFFFFFGFVLFCFVLFCFVLVFFFFFFFFFFCCFPPQLTGLIFRNGGLETGCPCETSPESCKKSSCLATCFKLLI